MYDKLCLTVASAEVRCDIGVQWTVCLSDSYVMSCFLLLLGARARQVQHKFDRIMLQGTIICKL